MREKIFRYRYEATQSWFTLEFDLEQILNGEPFEVLENEPLRKHFKMSEVVEQYTGIKDNKGVAIYEGDIVKATACDDKGARNDITGPVSFEEFEYVIDSEDENWPCVSWKCVEEAEVIGNIHDKEK